MDKGFKKETEIKKAIVTALMVMLLVFTVIEVCEAWHGDFAAAEGSQKWVIVNFLSGVGVLLTEALKLAGEKLAKIF